MKGYLISGPRHTIIVYDEKLIERIIELLLIDDTISDSDDYTVTTVFTAVKFLGE